MNREKIAKAVEIAKANNIYGKFRFDIDEHNGNVVIFINEAGAYCSINIKSGKVKDL